MRPLFLLSLVGCGFGHRSSLQSSVSVVAEGGVQDIAPLQRSEYAVQGRSSGSTQSTQVYVLWFPVGNQKSKSDLWDDAVYEAIAEVDGCDSLLLPHATTRTVVVPLIAVNFVTRKVKVDGRCVHVRSDEELAVR